MIKMCVFDYKKGGGWGLPSALTGLRLPLERSERAATRKCALAPLGARG